MRVPCPDARQVVAAQQPTQAQVSAHCMQEFDLALACRPARASDPSDAKPRDCSRSQPHLMMTILLSVAWSPRAPLPGPTPGEMRVLSLNRRSSCLLTRHRQIVPFDDSSDSSFAKALRSSPPTAPLLRLTHWSTAPSHTHPAPEKSPRAP